MMKAIFLLSLMLIFSASLSATSTGNLDTLNKQLINKQNIVKTAIAAEKAAEESLAKASANLKKARQDLMRTEVALHNAKTLENETKVEAQPGTKFGASEDDVPCNCVFNKNRLWNPEKIVWNNEEWECAHYNSDGLCEGVQKVRNH